MLGKGNFLHVAWWSYLVFYVPSHTDDEIMAQKQVCSYITYKYIVCFIPILMWSLRIYLPIYFIPSLHRTLIIFKDTDKNHMVVMMIRMWKLQTTIKNSQRIFSKKCSNILTSKFRLCYLSRKRGSMEVVVAAFFFFELAAAFCWVLALGLHPFISRGKGCCRSLATRLVHLE